MAISLAEGDEEPPGGSNVTELSTGAVRVAELGVAANVEAPPLVPCVPALDRAHLANMTGGDRALEREVLQLFAMQAGMLLGRMHNATSAEIGAFAHTLCGSARGIGAWRVAEAAEALERDAAAGCDIVVGRERLTRAIGEVKAVIAEFAKAGL
jgi:Hpt domain